MGDASEVQGTEGDARRASSMTTVVILLRLNALPRRLIRQRFVTFERSPYTPARQGVQVGMAV